MKLSFEILALSLMVCAILSLKTVVGDATADVVMWAIAGWKLGDVAHRLGLWMYNKYMEHQNV